MTWQLTAKRLLVNWSLYFEQASLWASTTQQKKKKHNTQVKDRHGKLLTEEEEVMPVERIHRGIVWWNWKTVASRTKSGSGGRCGRWWQGTIGSLQWIWETFRRTEEKESNRIRWHTSRTTKGFRFCWAKGAIWNMYDSPSPNSTTFGAFSAPSAPQFSCLRRWALPPYNSYFQHWLHLFHTAQCIRPKFLEPPFLNKSAKDATFKLFL